MPCTSFLLGRQSGLWTVKLLQLVCVQREFAVTKEAKRESPNIVLPFEEFMEEVRCLTRIALNDSCSQILADRMEVGRRGCRHQRCFEKAFARLQRFVFAPRKTGIMGQRKDAMWNFRDIAHAAPAVRNHNLKQTRMHILLSIRRNNQ